MPRRSWASIQPWSGKNCARRRASEGMRCCPAAADGLNEAERVLLRAAASPPESRICLRVFQALHDQPQSFEGLSVAPILHLLRDRGPQEPLARISEPSQRALLAQALFRESGEVELSEVEAALESLKYRHLEALQRRVRADIAEAERTGRFGPIGRFHGRETKSRPRNARRRRERA